MSRKALFVGINHYEHFPSLSGCVNDATSLRDILKRNENGKPNFLDAQLLDANGNSNVVNRIKLEKSIVELFNGESETVLFYFAGHGHIEKHGGFICTTDTKYGYDGIALYEITQIATFSQAKNVIIILDSCFSGSAGEKPIFNEVSEIRDGMVILAACTSNQVAEEIDSRGIFTSLLIEALEGTASNILGEISASSAYAHIDKSLGNRGQRPLFKANVNSFVPLREINPHISQKDLNEIATLFSNNEEINLDPTFVQNKDQYTFDFEKVPDAIEENVEKYRILNELLRINLVETKSKELFLTAMFGQSCKLTKLGKYYRNLVNKNQI